MTERADGGDTTMTNGEDALPTLTLVADLEGHSDRAWGLAWNPRLPLLASSSSDKDVRLHSFILPSSARQEDGTAASASSSSSALPLPKFSLQEIIPTGHRRTVRSVAWSPSGKTLATASFDSTVGIWERVADVMSAIRASESEARGFNRHSSSGSLPPIEANGAGERNDGEREAEWDCIGTLEGHDNECKAVAFSHNGSLLASCSRDKSVWIWEVQDEAEFDCLSVLMEHSQDVKYVAWHPREEMLASASYDDTIRLYIDDPSDDWFCYTTLTGHTSTIWSLSFSPCGTFLASASEDQTIRIWRRLTVDQAEERGLKVYGKIDGTRKGDRWICVRILKGFHSRSIYSVSWGHADQTHPATPKNSLGRIASTGADGTICVFDVCEADTDSVQKGPQSGNVDVLAPEVTLSARVWNAHGDADLNCVCWAPDRLLPPLVDSASLSADPQSRIQELTDEEAKEHDANGLAQNSYPLGNLLASSADDGSVKVWRF